MAPRGTGHEPVLREQVLRVLEPAGRRVLLDCTLGPGGHAEALLDAAGEGARLIGVDLDESSLALARERLSRFGGRVRLFRANFADLDEVLAAAETPQVDLLLADLGVASTQLDDPARGLSFQADGPLDMRLGAGGGPTAAELVNTLSEKALADLIYRYGEERYSRRIARAIVAERRHNRIERTGQLARVVAGAVPAAARRSRRGVHPATRTFQALRIAVNDELGNLRRLLEQLPGVLAPGGRAGVISFHSLEDRPVKRHFARLAAEGSARLLTARPITATPEQVAANPRSRSAKLRAIERPAEGPAGRSAET